MRMGTRRKTTAKAATSAGLAGFFTSQGFRARSLLLRNSVANRVPDEPSAAFSDSILHKICGTRLWTACTRLILQQIEDRIFD